MDIMQAVTYPFKGKNAVCAMVIPAAVQFAGALVISIPVVVIYIVFFLSIMGAGAVDMSEEQVGTMVLAFLPMIIIAVIVLTVLMMLIVAPWYGYLWHLLARVWEFGGNAEAPTWKGNMKQYYKDGLQCSLVGLVMTIPWLILMPLVILSFGLLAPFMTAPYALAAREKTFSGFFRSIGPGFELVRKNYGDWLVATYALFGYMIVFMILNIGLQFIPFASIFMSSAAVSTYVHLFGQLLHEQLPFHETAQPTGSAWDVAT